MELVNALDPKFNTPYVFTVLVLPHLDYPNRFAETVRLGKRGIVEADPDWRIPFYVGAMYHLQLKDRATAAQYFDIAARTNGIPETVRRYALNYGIYPNVREETKQIWQTIAASTNDAFMRERARAYVTHFDILDMLDAAVKTFHGTFGRYPETMEELVEKKIISEIPQDPFGLEFAMYAGGVVGIKQP